LNLRPRAPFLLCACAALALSACGSSSSSKSAATTSSAPATTPATSTPATTPSTAAAKLTIEADPTGQLAFVQKSLTAKAGKVTINFTNQSPVPHNVAVESAGKELGMTPVITSGSKTLTLTLAKGTYTYFCTVDSHRQAGMQGTLAVN
jgi:plastocyanin